MLVYSARFLITTTAEKRLEEYNDVFADIFDNLLFDGRKVIDEKQLEARPTESFARMEDGSLRQGNRDILKFHGKQGCYRLLCGIENQTGIDNTMPQRVMGYDYAAYEEQVRKICSQNEKAGNKAYAKRIHDDQRLVPVVTAVLYYDTKNEWKHPLCLHDMLEFPKELEDIIKPYVADYLACKNSPEELKKFMEENDQKIRHPEEFLDVMSEVAGDKRYQKIKEKLVNRAEEEEINMCWIAEEFENRGISQGVTQGIRILIKTCEEFGVTKEDTKVRIIRDFSVTEEKAELAMQEYWGVE